MAAKMPNSIDNIIRIILDDRKSVFLTGGAGVGKTYMANQLFTKLDKMNYNISRTATTGLAAQLINGKTIHSFLGLPIIYIVTKSKYPDLNDIDKIIQVSKIEDIVNTDILMIDEISMMNDMNFDMLVTILKRLTTKYAQYQIELRTSSKIVSTIIELLSRIDIGLNLHLSTKSEIEHIMKKEAPILESLKEISAILSTLRTDPKYRFISHTSKINCELLRLVVQDISVSHASELQLNHWETKNTLAEKLFTGYIRLIMIGDLHQLPPVVRSDTEEINLLNYIIYSPAFNEKNIKTVHLTDNMRQKDDIEFSNILNNIRDGKITPKVRQFLRRLCISKNAICDNYIELMSKNEDVDKKNLIELAKIDSESTKYISIDESYLEISHSHLNEIADTYNIVTKGSKMILSVANREDRVYNIVCVKSIPHILNTEHSGSDNICWYTDKKFRLNISDRHIIPKKIDSQLITDRVLELKIGAEVIIIKNTRIDTNLTVYNGERGTVIDMSDDDVTISMTRGEDTFPVRIPRVPVITDNDHYTYVRYQIPLKLAYAITIHKSQGMTLTHGVVNIDKWNLYHENPGMAYVALSRFNDRNRLKIRGSIHYKGIKSDPVVQKFYADESIEEEVNKYNRIKYGLLNRPIPE